MFSGIIQEIGVVTNIDKNSGGSFCSIKSKKISNKVKLGDSISVNGVCLTVSNIKNDIFSVNIIDETLNISNLSNLKTNTYVNLEPAISYNEKIDGHSLLPIINGDKLKEEIAYIETANPLNEKIPPKVP